MLRSKMFKNPRKRIEKTSIEWAHTVSLLKSIKGTAISKEGHADCPFGFERTHHYLFPWKKVPL